jgi:hypothetical protein
MDTNQMQRKALAAGEVTTNAVAATNVAVQAASIDACVLNMAKGQAQLGIT